MATRNQLNPPPLRKITDFKSKLSGGGARSNLFECELAFPPGVNVEGLNDIFLMSLHYDQVGIQMHLPDSLLD